MIKPRPKYSQRRRCLPALKEQSHEVRISLILSEPVVTDEDADKLYEAGCEGASILTRDGLTRHQFDRRPAILDEALAWAIQSIERAGMAMARVEIERHGVPQVA